MGTLGEAVVAIGADTTGFEKQAKSGVDSAMSSASKTISKVGAGFSQAGKSLTTKVTLPLIGLGLVSLHTAAKFETSMNTLQVAAGASSKEVDSLSKLAIQLGADTVFSAGEAADAMVELAKGGFTPAEIAGGGVQATMALAATEGLALADAATIAGNAMNAFGLEAADASSIADALAGGANASSASVKSLSEGLGNVSAMAVDMGLSIQDTVGVLAALDNAGIKGAEGGTALKSLLTSLLPATTKAKDAMEAYGLSFVNADGSMKNIGNIAGQLRKTFGKMGEAERGAALQTIFGSYAKNAASILMKNGEKGIRSYIKATTDQGAAQQLADARMKGTAGAIERMKGALETAALVIGQAIAPTVSQMAGFIGNLAEKFATLSGPVKQFIIVGAAIAAALGPVLIIVGALISAIGAIAGVFAGVSAAVLAPIAAVVLLVAAIGILLAKSEKARAVVSNTFSAIVAIVKPAIDSMVGTIKGELLPAFQSMWPILEKVGVIILKVFGSAVIGAVKGVMNILKGLVKIVTGVVQVISGVLTGDWARAWDGVKNIVTGVLQAVIGAIQVWLNVGIFKIFKIGFTLLTGAIRSGWGLIKSLWSSSLNGIKSLTSKIVNFLLLPFRLSFQLVKAVVSNGWRAIRSIFTAYVQTIKTIVTVGFRVWRSVVSATMNAVKMVITTAWRAIRSAVSNSVSAVRSVVSNAFNALRGIVSSAWNAVRSAVVTGVTRAVAVVKSLPGKMVAALASAAGSLRSVGVNIVQGLITGIQSMAGQVVSTLVGLLPGPLKKFAGKLGISSPSKVFYRFGKWTTKGFINGIADGRSGVLSSLGKLADELKKNGEKGAVKIVSGFQKRLDPMGRALDSIGKRLERAQSTFNSRLDQMRQYASQVGSNLIESVFTGDEENIPTFNSILGDLRTQKNEADRFARSLERLRALGLNRTSYDQIASAGPDALAAAEAIVKAGKSGVRQINSIQGGINSSAKRAGDVASKYLYNAGVKAAEGVVNGLEKKEARLERQMTRLGNALGRAIAKSVNSTAKGLSSSAGRGAKVKKHAAGTTRSNGGWAMVGERGRELVNLPSGSRVYPAHQTERMTEDVRGEAKIEINQNYYGPTTGRGRLTEVEWALRYATKGKVNS